MNASQVLMMRTSVGAKFLNLNVQIVCLYSSSELIMPVDLLFNVL